MSSGVFITESECCDRTCYIAILVPKTNETEACLVGEEISQINKNEILMNCYIKHQTHLDHIVMVFTK